MRLPIYTNRDPSPNPDRDRAGPWPLARRITRRHSAIPGAASGTTPVGPAGPDCAEAIPAATGQALGRDDQGTAPARCVRHIDDQAKIREFVRILSSVQAWRVAPRPASGQIARRRDSCCSASHACLARKSPRFRSPPPGDARNTALPRHELPKSRTFASLSTVRQLWRQSQVSPAPEAAPASVQKRRQLLRG